MMTTTIRFGESRHVMGTRSGIFTTSDKTHLIRGDGRLDGPLLALADRHGGQKMSLVDPQSPQEVNPALTRFIATGDRGGLGTFRQTGVTRDPESGGVCVEFVSSEGSAQPPVTLHLKIDYGAGQVSMGARSTHWPGGCDGLYEQWLVAPFDSTGAIDLPRSHELVQSTGALPEGFNSPQKTLEALIAAAAAGDVRAFRACLSTDAAFKTAHRREESARALMCEVVAAGLEVGCKQELTDDGATQSCWLANGADISVELRLTREGWKVTNGLDRLAERRVQKPVLTSTEHAFRTLQAAVSLGDPDAQAACLATPEASKVAAEMARNRVRLGPLQEVNAGVMRHACTVEGTVDFIHTADGWKVSFINLPGVRAT